MIFPRLHFLYYRFLHSITKTRFVVDFLNWFYWFYLPYTPSLNLHLICHLTFACIITWVIPLKTVKLHKLIYIIHTKNEFHFNINWQSLFGCTRGSRPPLLPGFLSRSALRFCPIFWNCLDRPTVNILTGLLCIPVFTLFKVTIEAF